MTKRDLIDATTAGSSAALSKLEVVAAHVASGLLASIPEESRSVKTKEVAKSAVELAAAIIAECATVG